MAYQVWIVCGSRKLEDGAWVSKQLDAMASRHGLPRVLIHGDANGADRQTKAWGLRQTGVEVRDRPADWERHKNGAGPVRNRQMATEAEIIGRTLVIAFPIVGLKNAGTLDMVSVAASRGFPFVGIPYFSRASG